MPEFLRAFQSKELISTSSPFVFKPSFHHLLWAFHRTWVWFKYGIPNAEKIFEETKIPSLSWDCPKVSCSKELGMNPSDPHGVSLWLYIPNDYREEGFIPRCKIPKAQSSFIFRQANCLHATEHNLVPQRKRRRRVWMRSVTPVGRGKHWSQKHSTSWTQYLISSARPAKERWVLFHLFTMDAIVSMRGD